MSAVDEAVAKFTPDEGDFIPSQVVAEACTWLEENDADALAAWLWDRRHAILNELLTRRLVAQRAVTLKRARARAFGSASSAFDEGDAEPMSHFQLVYVVDGENTRRRVGDMTGADHQFVADQYEVDGRYSLLLGEFHRQVAKRVKSKRTADVLDEATYERIYVSILGRDAA